MRMAEAQYRVHVMVTFESKDEDTGGTYLRAVGKEFMLPFAPPPGMSIMDDGEGGTNTSVSLENVLWSVSSGQFDADETWECANEEIVNQRAEEFLAGGWAEIEIYTA
jgi:hypothetical protein